MFEDTPPCTFGAPSARPPVTDLRDGWLSQLDSRGALTRRSERKRRHSTWTIARKREHPGRHLGGRCCHRAPGLWGGRPGRLRRKCSGGAQPELRCYRRVRGRHRPGVRGRGGSRYSPSLSATTWGTRSVRSRRAVHGAERSRARRPSVEPVPVWHTPEPSSSRATLCGPMTRRPSAQLACRRRPVDRSRRGHRRMVVVGRACPTS